MTGCRRSIVALDITPDLIARFSAARVMSRPAYGQLIPSGSANIVIRTASITNPYLDPIRANTIDAALEWYFAPGSLLSIAYFHKNIETYIQNTNQLVPFRDLGLPLVAARRNGHGRHARRTVQRDAQQQHRRRATARVRGEPPAAVPFPAGGAAQFRCARQLHARTLEHRLHHLADPHAQSASRRALAGNRQRHALL